MVLLYFFLANKKGLEPINPTQLINIVEEMKVDVDFCNPKW